MCITVTQGCATLSKVLKHPFLYKKNKTKQSNSALGKKKKSSWLKWLFCAWTEVINHFRASAKALENSQGVIYLRLFCVF